MLKELPYTLQFCLRVMELVGWSDHGMIPSTYGKGCARPLEYGMRPFGNINMGLRSAGLLTFSATLMVAKLTCFDEHHPLFDQFRRVWPARKDISKKETDQVGGGSQKISGEEKRAWEMLHTPMTPEAHAVQTSLRNRPYNRDVIGSLWVSLKSS